MEALLDLTVREIGMLCLPIVALLIFLWLIGVIMEVIAWFFRAVLQSFPTSKSRIDRNYSPRSTSTDQLKELDRQLNQFKVKDLKKVLAGNNLPVSGTKKELIIRLLENIVDEHTNMEEE